MLHMKVHLRFHFKRYYTISYYTILYYTILYLGQKVMPCLQEVNVGK